MKVCETCNLPMTEFDLRFEKNLKSNNITPKNKTCFHCYTEDNGIYKALKNKDKAIVSLKEDISRALDYMAVLLILIFAVVHSFHSENILWSYIGVALVCIAILFQIRGTYVATKKMKLEKDFSYSETRLVSTVSPDGTIVTKSQDFLVSGVDDGSDAKTWLFFTYFFWCILRPLIIYSKSNSHLKKICPKEIIKIYDKTKKEVKKIEISERIVKKQAIKISNHDKKIQETYQKYKMMDKKRQERELSKIEKPVLPLFQKKYLIADMLYVNESKAYLMFYRNSSGQITGNVIIDGYFVNSNGQDWSDAWFAIHSKSSRNNKESYPERLNYIINSNKMYL